MCNLSTLQRPEALLKLWMYRLFTILSCYNFSHCETLCVAVDELIPLTIIEHFQ